MSETRLIAEPRTEFGKGAARRVRRANKVPAVLYGHGEKPRHVSLPGHDLALALRGDINVLLTLELDGGTELALPRAVVRDPIKGFLEHVDLLLVRSGEQVSIDLALSLVGDPAPGAMAQQQLQSVSVQAEATSLPEALEISIEGMRAGTQLTAGEVVLPKGTSLLTDADAIVVSVASITGELETGDAAESGDSDADTGGPDATGEADTDAADATGVAGETS